MKHITRSPDLAHKRGEALRFRNAVIKELYDGETDEVKEEVNCQHEEGNFSEDEDAGDDDVAAAAEERRVTTALNFQK